MYICMYMCVCVCIVKIDLYIVFKSLQIFTAS